jgi:hypothetical protein
MLEYLSSKLWEGFSLIFYSVLGVSGTRILTSVEDTVTHQMCVMYLGEGHPIFQHLFGQKCAMGMYPLSARYLYE